MTTETLPHRLFDWIVHHPKRVVLLCVLLIFASAAFIPSMAKDTRADAFLAEYNPALLYREKVKSMFGLSDPVVVAVVSDDSIFTVDGLNTLHYITNTVLDVNNVDPDGVTSLATENNIVGTEEGMEVDAFYEGALSTQVEANKVKAAIRNFPLYQGSLVAHDESASLVLIEFIDESLAEQTYQDIVRAVDTLVMPEGISVHIAGEGAISGYLGAYIDADAQRLNPMAGLIITLIVFIAFLRFATTLTANLIIGASVLITLGVMTAAGIPFYVITNALPVILIGIAVADSIHIYSEYFERRAHHRDESINDSIIASMDAMWRPVTLTTLTTVAGFMGLYFAAYMPPFRYFGLFTALGVSVAWLYSMTFLPAAMSLLKTEAHLRLRNTIQSQGHDVFTSVMISLGKVTHKHSKWVITSSALVAIAGLFFASQLLVNEDRINTFHPTEALYIADKEINARFDGSNYLDIVIETQTNEGIFEPDILHKIETLQKYAETLPTVQGSTSIVDYLKQMNRSLMGGASEHYNLPDDKDLIAQYFLLYSASSDPTDFEEEIDYDYRMANVRLVLNSGAFTDSKLVVESLENYVQSNFNNADVKATLSGRVSLNYYWIKDLGTSHFTGMGIALFLVWLVASLLFKSFTAGTFTLLPVVTSILIVYSSMVIFSIPLGIGTSMFAAVAIGLGVDFAIHTIDRLQSLYRETHNMHDTFQQFYPSTGRALFFNLLALFLGFGVLISSKVVPLNNFGIIVAMSVMTSFLVSMTLIPALISVFKPQFITGEKSKNQESVLLGATAKSTLGAVVLSATVIVASTALLPLNSIAESLTDKALPETALPVGRTLMKNVNALDEGEQVTRKLSMRTVDKRGKERTRETISYRKYYGNEKRTVLYYLKPRNVKDTGFLTFDYPEATRDDDQWLYLPALRKARRISASDRGDYFLGTDFSYEDIKKEGKVEINDFRYTTLAKETLDGRSVYHVEALPIDEATAHELGYGKVHSWIDPITWVIVKAQYWDIKMNDLKTLSVQDIRQVNGIWTRHKLTVNNHKTGHFTEFVFSEVDYLSSINEKVFTKRSLIRGAP